MTDILLSMPAFYLYLVYVVALLIAALRSREPGSPVGEPRTTALTTGRSVGVAPVPACCNLDRAPLPGSVLRPPDNCRPFQDLQATLSANYAARLEQALRTIRVGPPAEASRTIQAAGRAGGRGSPGKPPSPT
jgi:hypothetical protein